MTTETPSEPHVLGLLERALGISCAASLRAAVKLGLADALDTAPATAEDLAAAVGADPDALRRLLRSLTCHGVFTEDSEGGFAHTDVSRLLRTDTPDSLDQLVLWMTEPWTWELWAGSMRRSAPARTSSSICTARSSSSTCTPPGRNPQKCSTGP
ncbi:methyltransferase dimerization domain-containing protein [Streptomyces sp. DG1A-41]|uniref:methyltransferase family protein n=1 Tax=Streptomyces sp. DG1A-41 TaxID=3125779 RepID=UPI0030CAAE4B